MIGWGTKTAACRARERVVSAGTDVADENSGGVGFATCTHRADDFYVILMAVCKEGDFAVNIINRIDDIVRLPAVCRRSEESCCITGVEELVAAVEGYPGGYGCEALSQAVNLRCANVSKSSDGVTV